MMKPQSMKSQLKPLLSEEEIALRVKALAKEIEQKYNSEDKLLLVGTLKGSFIFLADLVRHLSIDIEIDFLSASSYGNTSTSGEVRILKDLGCPVKDRPIILVEDIVDTGKTINYLMNMLADREARSIEVCTLLDKPDRRLLPVKTHYVGFEIDDLFVVGYGLDYDEKGRQLPYIAVIETHD